MMGGAWRKGDRRSSLTYSSLRNYKRGNERLDRHGKERKSLYSPRRHDDGDDFESRHSRHRSKQSRHPHHSKERPSKSRKPSWEFQDSPHYKCRESEYRRLHRIKEEPLDRRSRASEYRPLRRIKEEPVDRRSRASPIYRKRETLPKRRCSSSPSRDHKSLLQVNKKGKYEEKNLAVKDFEGKKVADKSSSLKEFSNYFFEKSDKYMTQGSLKKALKCINVALKACKKENTLSSKLYSRRGTIYSLLEKPRCSFQGFLDWEHSFIIDKDNMEARINMSKVFFKAANKLFRKKAYHPALTLCNHALGLHVKNGEASILLKLLKRKLLEKEKKKPSVVDIMKNPSTSTSVRFSPDNLSVARSLHGAVLDEIKRLNNLIAEALKSNNHREALKYCDLALRFFKCDIPDDNLYHSILALKKKLMNLNA